MTIATSTEPQPIFLAGRWVTSPDVLAVANPADESVSAGATFLATADQYEEAVIAAGSAFEVTRRLPAYERGRILREVSAGVLRHRDELARLLTSEVGKPISESLFEVDRAALTFRLGAEEAERMTGDFIPLDLMPYSKDRVAVTQRFPIGPIAAVCPFNYPLHLAAHKIAPAIASGNTIVLKPSSKVPLTVLALASIIEAANAPDGAVSILPMSRELGDRMVSDERFRLLSFTGSTEVGWQMKDRAGRKKVVLELGGNAAVIIDKSADLEWAVERSLVGAFTNAGQACISLQRMYLHEDVWDEFLEPFIAGAAALKVGDPLDPATKLGPMIDAAAADRARSWVDEAVAMGGRLLTGGSAAGAFMSPTVLADVPRSARVCSREVFAPVVVVSPFRELDEAIAQVNDSRYGLHAGVITNDFAGAWRAFRELEVSGVIINDIPGYRTDHMPYGGVKESGIGREGVRYSMDEMTEIRVMVVVPPRTPYPRPRP